MSWKKYASICFLFVFMITSCNSVREVELEMSNSNTEEQLNSKDLSDAYIELVRASYENKSISTEKEFIANVEAKIGARNTSVLNRKSDILLSSTKNLDGSHKVFCETLEEIKEVMYDKDYNKLNQLFEDYYLSNEFKSLDDKSKMDIRTLFGAIDMSRFEILKIVVENENAIKLSPGDRMVWRDWTSRASKKNLQRAIDWNMIGISFYGIPGAIIGGAYSFVRSFF